MAERLVMRDYFLLQQLMMNICVINMHIKLLVAPLQRWFV